MTVKDLIATLGTPEHRKQVFAHLHELRRVHTETVTIQRINKRGIGRSLRQMRTDSRIPQLEMAAKLNVTPGYLCQCEAGQAELGMMETVLFLHWCSVSKT